MIEDELGQQLRASVSLEELQRDEHLLVAIAVERGEQRLERVQVQRDQPVVESHAAAPKALLEERQVGRLEPQEHDEPHSGEGRDGNPHHPHARVEVDHPEDAERRERLTAPLAHPVDHPLEALAQLTGQRQVEHLRRGPVQ